MACHGVEALASDPEIELVCMLNPANRKLMDRLAPFDRLPLTTNFKSLTVDRILCIQGDIAQSTNGILAAKNAGIKCISYLAIPHRLSEMGAKLGRFRDGLNQRFVNAPDRYITISESMKTLLSERGATVTICVVPNGIPLPQKRNVPPPHSPFTLGLLGRIEFNQKQQDFMVRTVLAHPDIFGGCRLLLAGNGPDKKSLERLIEGHHEIVLLPWQNTMDAFYDQIDMLVIPSRFEGVPLVMLEALARGIPVIGSARDGMKDLLPEAWTFETENAEALARTFSAVRDDGWQDTMPALQQKVCTDFSLDTFKTNFYAAVMES